MNIQIERADMLEGSPENAWDDVVHHLSRSLGEILGLNYDNLVSKFSTTGDVERTVCEIAILDVYLPYFSYSVKCICGIPSITLEGTAGDWRALAAKAEISNEYEMDWWLADLRPILNQFHLASSGGLDREFWQNIYKQEQAYGVSIINGWFVRLFPYLKCNLTGKFTKINPQIGKPLIDQDGAKTSVTQGGGGFDGKDDVTSNSIPSALSQVPFNLIDA